MQEAMDKRNETVEPSNDYLLLFLDNSFSMLGKPFESLKQSCLEIAEQIFDENP